MLALRSTRNLHTGPHPAPLRQFRCSPVRNLLRAGEPMATCSSLEDCDIYGNNLEDEIWHMASFRPATTGLPMWILHSPAYPPLDQPRMLVRKECGRRPKVWQGDDFPYFTITVDEEPQVLDQNTGSIQQADIELVKQYIKLNFDAIVRFWKNDDVHDLCKTLKPLQNRGTATSDALSAE